MAKFNINHTKLQKFLSKTTVEAPVIVSKNKLDIAYKQVRNLKTKLYITRILLILSIISLIYLTII